MSRILKAVLQSVPQPAIIMKAPRNEPVLFLTFEDGPNETVTLELLDLLARFNAKATFFCIGQQIERFPNVARRIVDEGHLLSNHSFFHKSFSRLPLTEQLNEINRTDAIIERLTGQQNRYFRVPQGNWSMRLIWSLWRRGTTCAHWTYDSGDYQKTSPANILEFFKSKPVANGEIVLFHDDNELCIHVLKSLLPEWQRQGYRFARICDMHNFPNLSE